MTKAAVATQIAKKIVHESRFREGKADNDTVRLWENYREQALLWRALALLQFPASALALIFALVMWINREVVLDVPARPLPGIYSSSEIQDAEFLGSATDFINLIATYQPKTARRQFQEAAKFLVEPMLSKFDDKMMGRELKAIEDTRRSQIYHVDPNMDIQRLEDETVVVTMVGERVKYVAGEQLPEVSTQFRLTMTTIPRNTLNPYGIVIINVETTHFDPQGRQIASSYD